MLTVTKSTAAFQTQASPAVPAVPHGGNYPWERHIINTDEDYEPPYNPPGGNDNDAPAPTVH